MNCRNMRVVQIKLSSVACMRPHAGSSTTMPFGCSAMRFQVKNQCLQTFVPLYYQGKPDSLHHLKVEVGGVGDLFVWEERESSIVNCGKLSALSISLLDLQVVLITEVYLEARSWISSRNLNRDRLNLRKKKIIFQVKARTLISTLSNKIYFIRILYKWNSRTTRLHSFKTTQVKALEIVCRTKFFVNIYRATSLSPFNDSWQSV